MTVRPMNAKALGHVALFIAGIQFRALVHVKTQKVTRNETAPAALMRHASAASALDHCDRPLGALSVAPRPRDGGLELVRTLRADHEVRAVVRLHQHPPRCRSH